MHTTSKSSPVSSTSSSGSSSRRQRLVRVVAATLALGASLSVIPDLPSFPGLPSLSAGTAAAAPDDPTPEPLDTWAWCGVHPDDPTAAVAARSMADAAGIDATFGPCNVPTPDYTPAFTANRYVSPELYRRLVDINAAAGIKTVVYDARLWSPNAVVRADAVQFWSPVFEHIAAWDLGDEFDPSGSEWPLLIQRWNLVLADVTPVSGIRPFTNHLSSATDEALADLTGTEQLLSFASYAGDLGASIARSHASEATLMCGVNVFDHHVFFTNPDKIRADMAALRSAGCDQFLIFGGQRVYGSNAFGVASLVDSDGAPTAWAPAVQEGSGRSSFTGVGPARLLESRLDAGSSTVDGLQMAVGRRGAGSVTAVDVVGRAGVPSAVAAVSLNITAVDPVRDGFITAYPCGAVQPNAAQLNYSRRVTLSTAVLVEPGDDGRVCVFTLSDIDLVIDVNGYMPLGAAFEAVLPARLLETRAEEWLTTVDGRDSGIGTRGAGTITELQVAGRAGVPSTVNAVVLSVTVTNTRTAGFVTVFPCGGATPTSSNLNFASGATMTNAVVTSTDASGKVCLYTMSAVDMVVDLGGYLPVAAPISTAPPVRVLDSRAGPGLSTIDGLQFAIGARASDTVTTLPIGGRGGIPSDAGAVVLDVTVTDAERSGFVTVFPCGTARPTASHLNFAARQTLSNMVVADLAADGTVCLYAMAGTHLVVDVLSYLP